MFIDTTLLRRKLLQSDVDCWLMYSDEGSDRLFHRLVSPKLVVPSLALVSEAGAALVAHSLDADNVVGLPGWEVRTYGTSEEMWDHVRDLLSKAKWPRRIGLNYSEMGDTETDMLRLGQYRTLVKRIRPMYSASGQRVLFPSAERLAYGVLETKSERDLRRISLAARRAEELLRQAYSEAQVGQSEIEMNRSVRKLMEKRPEYFDQEEIVGEECAWDPDACPTVLTGPSLVKGGHAEPSECLLEPGHTLYMDFGVTLIFSDGERWSSDLQRMGYVLRDGESAPPTEVCAVFKALYEAISIGIENLRPAHRGFEVDAKVRSHLRARNYPDYDHATGHGIGEVAHGLGTILAPKSRSRSRLNVQDNAVYTIEPRIPMVNGGSVEEMVLATPNGGRCLSPRQEAIIVCGRG